MISFMAFCKDMVELIKIQEASKKSAAIVSEYGWKMHFYNSMEQVIKKIEEKPLLDVICFDLAQDEGITYVKYLRECYEKAYMILLANLNMSPREYVRPDVMPSGLIIQPATYDETYKVLRGVFESYLKKVILEENNKVYKVSTRNGIVNIPYNKISYFESREKKIYLRYGDKEIGFYSTMDKLESELENDFVRTHRSFLVNKKHIYNVNLSENIIVLIDENTVPISRRYKMYFKVNGYAR